MKKQYCISVCILFFLLCQGAAAQDAKGLLIKKIKGNEGKRWAVCIGIKDYWEEKIADLEKAQNDAKGLAKIFNTIGQFDKVYTMTDDLDLKDKNYPTKFNIEDRIDYIMKMARKNDLIVFAFSGHGIADAQGQSYLVPADVRLNKPYETSFELDYIVSKLKEKKIEKSLLLIDACREEMQESKGLKAGGFSTPIYSKAELAAIFYATKAGWYSYEDKQSDYGIFTRFLIEGLKGKANSDNDSIVSFSELEKYVMKTVFDYALELDIEQCPYTKIYGEKFGDLALTAINSSTTIVEDDENPENMVLVKAGSFEMGSNDGEDGEKPVHTIRITEDFWIGKYEVTFTAYDAFCTATGTEKPDDRGWGRGNRPVIYVSWEDAVLYCNWKSKKEGLAPCYTGGGKKITCDFSKNGYRLPTEAEWEYAARGGNKSKGYVYAGSNIAEEVSWFDSTSDNKTRTVGTKIPNELGLYDMSGNVVEWCWDWYAKGYYKISPVSDPTGPEKGVARVFRGGCWFDVAGYVRFAYRGYNVPGGRGRGIGFRLARGHNRQE
ncbi:MAG: SUMF1/EgtB/PvdO family nonheme iron enzyme [Spirochaetales bacterium]|nr:SUMF1/EgtB/PvdO family nonheme iron enzyme [Spirochaetales bacterium]